MTADIAWGPAHAIFRRSLQGFLVGAAAIVAVFGALIAWNLIRRPGLPGALAVAMLVGVAILAALIFLQGPHTITIHVEGILIRAIWRKPLAIAWEAIESVRIWRAPLGRNPTVVSVHPRNNKSLTISDAEYTGLDKLLEVLVANLADRIEDER